MEVVKSPSQRTYRQTCTTSRERRDEGEFRPSKGTVSSVHDLLKKNHNLDNGVLGFPIVG